LVIGVLLIVLAVRVVRPVCRTVAPPTQPSPRTTAPTPPARDTPPDFAASVGIDNEELCDTDLRLPAAFAVAGVAAIVAGVRLRPKR